ncbi:hypothetical protein GGR22_001167 [Flavobacterium gossypii]|uniref:Fibronectin type-III domain-containing protein n=1 Tax=Flavobacterium gossypii TaxID=1646119 RepID=A0ABR6DP23_9FLAO|nr:GEVED domain-containing protein [Flavobacterium gossypii]MBA9073041.1 hypothetical protein [Flavobacterium gossypii]
MKKITFPYRGLPRVKRWLALLSFACTSPVLLANSNPDADAGSLVYCTPAASSTIRFIKDFSTTGGFPNIYNANTGIGTGGYANHTDKKVSQSSGGTINFSTVYSGGNFGLAIWIDWNNNETFEPAEMMSATTAVAASHTGTITIPAGTPVGNYRMRVLADYNTAVPSNPCSFNAANTSGEAEDYTFEVIAPPSCLPATALGASNVTLTAAQLTWTSEGTSFDVEYGPSGFTQGTGTMATSVGNTYNASGLTPDTWYQFYIRSNCGTGDKSPWAGPFRFYTGYCLPSTTTTGYFINRFTTTGGYTNINNTGTTLGAGGYSNYAAQKVSYFENASVSFSAAYTSGCGFAIWIDWNNNMLFDTGERVFNTTASGAAATGTITVPAGTPVGNYRMRIRIDGNNTNPADPCNFATLGRGEAEDYTFEIVAAPSCRPPTNLGAGNLTFTTAQLSWTGSGTVFDIEYGPAGFAQGTGTMISSVGNPYNTTGLTPETSYHYYVRMDCGVNGKSTWVGPFRFYTGYCLPVATVATSYIKDFSTTGGGSNISNLNTGQGTSGYANHTAMTVSQYEGASVNFSAVYNSATLGLAIWIDWNNNMIFDTGERVFNTTALAASTTGSITVPAGTPIGSYRMRVLADRNSNNPNNPCSFFAANGSGEAEDYTFVVVAPPSCRPPTNLGAGNLTFTTAQISWTGSGTLFDVEYGPAGFTQGTGTMVSSIGNPYNATGLTPE